MENIPKKNDNTNYYASLVIFQTYKNVVLRNVHSHGWFHWLYLYPNVLKNPYKYGCTKLFHNNEELLNMVQFHLWKFKKLEVRVLGKSDHAINIIGRLSMIMSGISWRLFLNQKFLDLTCWKYWILNKLLRKFKYFESPKKSN
jgi:hypothetical protein